MQRYYGICIDDVGGAVSVRHAAALARHLPFGSKTLESIDPRLGYTNSDWLLLGILNSLREEPYDPFASQSRKSKHKVMSVEELSDMLIRPRKEVVHNGD